MDIQIFDKVLMHTNGGLGDCFVSVGIVRYYSERAGLVYVPVAPKFLPTIRTLYQDLPNVQVIDNTKIDEIVTDQACFRLPLPSYIAEIQGKRPLWDEQLYTLHDLPFSLRYRYFILPKNLPKSKALYQKIVTNENYVLVHNGILPENKRINIDLITWRKTSEDTTRIQNAQVITIDENLSDNMMDYIDLIKNAKEIHCVPSSMHCLVDSINKQTQAKLYYHNIRDKHFMRVNNRYNDHRWIVVNYKVKY